MCNLPPAPLAEWLGSVMCHCINTWWNRHRTRVSTESSLWRNKLSHSSCHNENSQPFHHESGALPTSYPISPQRSTQRQSLIKMNTMMIIQTVRTNIIPAVRIWGECLTIQSPPALFFFKLGISLCTLIPLIGPGSVHSGSASWDDYGQVFPDRLHVSSFPKRFPH